MPEDCQRVFLDARTLMSRALRLADEIALIQLSQSLAEDVLKTKVSPPRGYEKTSWKARSSASKSKCKSFALAVLVKADTDLSTRAPLHRLGPVESANSGVS